MTRSLRLLHTCRSTSAAALRRQHYPLSSTSASTSKFVTLTTPVNQAGSLSAYRCSTQQMFHSSSSSSSSSTRRLFASSASSSSSKASYTTATIPAHGPTGELMELFESDPVKAAALKAHAITLQDLTLSRRQLCDIELLLTGAFSPLQGFMNESQYLAVVRTMHLDDAPHFTLFPMPITLDVHDKFAAMLLEKNIKELALKDEEGNILAVMEISDVYRPQLDEEAQAVFGGDPEHPAVQYLKQQSGSHYVGGTLKGLKTPAHYDHLDLRRSPRETRDFFAKSGDKWRKVTAFQTRNPLHRAHFELTVQACRQNGSALLLHPVVGMTKPGDIDHHTRVKCYRAIMPSYDGASALASDASSSSSASVALPALLSVLPLAMRMAGPREAIWHAIIRQNYGATHFILGRDHAGPGKNSKNVDFYTPYEARDLALKFKHELKIELTPFDMMLYAPSLGRYLTAKQVATHELATASSSSSSSAAPSSSAPAPIRTETLSGTEVRRRLESGAEIPEWFSFPHVVSILRSSNPPLEKRGYCVFFTGLSGSGKSTIANALTERLMSIDRRMLTLLDGDHVRHMLSSELGFSKEHRNLNIRRIGYVSSLIVKSGGAVIAAPIAPYQSSRNEARNFVTEYGYFCEVFVNSSIKTCEKRDRKGLYAKARAGLLKHFTGIDDPYEVPQNPSVIINDEQSVSEAVESIVQTLHKAGYLAIEK